MFNTTADSRFCCEIHIHAKFALELGNTKFEQKKTLTKRMNRN